MAKGSIRDHRKRCIKSRFYQKLPTPLCSNEHYYARTSSSPLCFCSLCRCLIHLTHFYLARKYTTSRSFVRKPKISFFLLFIDFPYVVNSLSFRIIFIIIPSSSLLLYFKYIIKYNLTRMADIAYINESL